MSLKLIQTTASKLLTINQDDYDVVIGIYDDNQSYRVLKNNYIEFDDSYFHISELMSYVVECNQTYNEMNGHNLDFLNKGFI